MNRRTAAHIVIGSDGNEALVLRDSAQATAVHTAGSRIAVGPAALALVIHDFSDLAATTDTLHGLVALNRQPRIWVDRSRERLLLRDALIDLDGRCFAASYRDIAHVIFGPKRARAAWTSASTALKEHLRRARAKGQALRDGGYRDLLERGCRLEH